MMKKYVYEHRKREEPPSCDAVDQARVQAALLLLELLPTKIRFLSSEEIKMNLLAKSCFSPGFIALMQNLITS